LAAAYGEDAIAHSQQLLALRRVLRAYARRNKVVGYCQGLNFIAGIYMRVYVCIFVCMYACIHTYRCTRTNIRVHVCKRTCMRTRNATKSWAVCGASNLARVHIFMCLCMFVCINTYARMYVFVGMYTDVYVCVCKRT